jgi:alpha-beta hydrolase superfamily lysophospholipase
MRRAAIALSLVLLTSSTLGVELMACSSSNNNHASGDGGRASDSGTDAAPMGTFTPEIPCTDTVSAVYADPGDVSSFAPGAIIKCAKDVDLSIQQLTDAVDVTEGGYYAYSGKPLTSSVQFYRVLYRTERGDPNNSPGYSSALLLIPDQPRLGTGANLPAIVSSHGSRGQAGHCAPSLDDPAGQYTEEDFQHQVWTLGGLGYAVLAPDLAGYAAFGAAGNPPPSYDDALDVGRSTLDGLRALRNIIPHSLTPQNVITGHSQGGYTAFAALAIADSYAADVPLSAIAVYSPLWLSQRSWGALLFDPTTYAFSNSAAGVVSMWYHYTHSYLLDGPDAALELFQPSQGAAVTSFVNNDCWSASYPDLMAAGASANDFFTADYVSAIDRAAVPALGDGNCNGNALCQTWLARMTADYPHLPAAAAQVPTLLFYANNDNTITPDDMQCVFNRLTGDNANYHVCYDPNPVGHSGVVAENASYVADWIAYETLDGGAPVTGNCSTIAPNDAGVPQLLTEDGGAWGCNSFISNQ